MEPLLNVKGIAVPFNRANVDTDQIIPARFIMKPRDFDYSQVLFCDLRSGPGAESGFPLDDAAYRGASIIVTGDNFACGSAREQAVYALQDAGLRVLVGPSFGGIFYTNCMKNGILPALVSAGEVTALCAALEAAPGSAVQVDLPRQVVIDPHGREIPFRIGESDKAQLMSGKDDISRTLEHEARMDEFEQALASTATWQRALAGDVLRREVRIHPYKTEAGKHG